VPGQHSGAQRTTGSSGHSHAAAPHALPLPLHAPHTTHHDRQIDQLNRERKLQQSAAGSQLRVLEDQYYSALRKNLEISAACQTLEDDMQAMQARMDALTGGKQQQAGGGGGGGGDEQQQQQQPQPNGAAGPDAMHA
jgi:hypothetical protein